MTLKTMLMVMVALPFQPTERRIWHFCRPESTTKSTFQFNKKSSSQEAARYGYELRLFDEAGFAYRGPLLSVTVEPSKFWSQVFWLMNIVVLNEER